NPNAPIIENQPDIGTERSKATFEVGDYSYSATLSFCNLQEGPDALVEGFAIESNSNEKGWLSADFVTVDGEIYGGVRIDIGVTEQFKSSDEFISMGDNFGGVISFSDEGQNYKFTAPSWDHNGEQLGIGIFS